MIKPLLCLFIIALCGIIGYGVSSFYVQRKKFFFCLLNFLDSLKSGIGFSGLQLLNIVNNSLAKTYQSKEFETLLFNYKKSFSINYKFEKEILFKDVKILTEQEKDSIFYFFFNLGKTDLKLQLEEIDKIYKINNSYFIDAKEESKKYSSLYVKLGVIIGAFVALIII